MPSPVLVRLRPRKRAVSEPRSLASPPLPWRGTTFLLAGGSLPSEAAQRRRQRHSLGISLVVQCGIVVGIAAGMRFGPRLPPIPANQPVTLVTLIEPPVPAYLPPPRPVRPQPRLAVRRLRVLSPPLPPPVRPAVHAAREQPMTPATNLAAAQPRALPRALTSAVPQPPPPPPAVKLGSFGDPHGLRPLPGAEVPAPEVGNFGRARSQPDPPDPPSRAKAGQAGFAGVESPEAADPVRAPSAATAHSAGFAAATETPAAATAETGGVHLHTFGSARPNLTPLHPKIAAQPNFQPPQMLSWPTPAYTADASHHRIQGEVVLQVRLGVNGQATVLRLVHGLGHGLDQSAMAAARQLRFRPAQRGGKPVDWVVLLHFRFRLAY